ncbi:hypothetical protein AGMMS50276_31870 [Synergistales bacterium]|nr:hypothetical protein AGMMS50276_31870 [Synergistales bacterium]
MQKLRARKGFTLVELLIVIVIIGILVGAMLLSSGSATATAKASAILSELRGLKGSMILYMADHNGGFTLKGATTVIQGDLTAVTAADGLGALAKMMDNPLKLKGSFYTVVAVDEKLFIGYKLAGQGQDAKAVAEKLANQAAKAGLVTSSGTQLTTVGSTDTVYMRVK